MTEDEIFDRLQTFFKAVNDDQHIIDAAYVPLGFVVDDHQNAPRSIGPYAMLTGQGWRDAAEADHYGYADIGDRVVEGRTRCFEYLFRLDFFASRATDYAKLFQMALRSSRAQTELAPFALRRVDKTASSPELIGGRWEGRAALNVELAALASEKVLIDVIDQGRVTLEGQTGATIIDGNVDYQRATPS